MFGYFLIYSTVILVVFVSGMLTGAVHTLAKLRQEAIKKNHAEYDTKTGEWKWK